MNIETLTEWLGWMTILNMGFMACVAIVLVCFKKSVSGIHSSMFDLKEDEISQMYFKYLAGYKLFIFVFNLMPYLALKIIA